MSRAPAAIAPRIDLVAIGMGVGFALMWSSAFSAARIALESAPPLWILSVRFLFAGALCVAVAKGFGQPLPKARGQWLRVAILGICQNSLYLGLYFLAMVTVPAGIAAITASAMPLLVAAGAAWLFAERLRPRALAGLGLGFVGVGGIMLGRLGGDVDLVGLTYCVVGVVALAAATLLVRHASFGTGLAMTVGLQMIIGGAVLVPFALFLEPNPIVVPRLSLLLAFLYMSFVPGILATATWFALVQRIGASHASAFHFLNPVFGVAIAAALLGEAITALEAVFVLVVTVGIALVQWPSRPQLNKISSNPK